MNKEFIKIYDRYFDDIYRYVYFKVGDRWNADDITSNVFLRAYQHRNEIKGDPGAWLFAIARNAMVDFYRLRNREVLSENLDDMAYPDDKTVPLEDELEHSQELECLKVALKQLNEEEREVISLRYFAGLKYRQMAQTLGTSEGAVKMRVRRILERIKEMVEKCL